MLRNLIFKSHKLLYVCRTNAEAFFIVRRTDIMKDIPPA